MNPARPIAATTALARRLRAAALAGLVLLAAPLPLGAAPPAPDDRFIAGYATAIARREFGLPAGVVRVAQGRVTVEAALPDARRRALVDALRAIEGVTEVAVAPPPAAAGQAPGRGPAPLAEGLLPGGTLFEPLVADPRWPHLALAFRRYLRGDLGDVLALSIGETVALWRQAAPAGGQWEAGVLGAVFSLFDLDAPSLDLVNADYLFGGFGAWRRGPYAALVRVFHQSSHLGDEFLLHHRVERVNVSFEQLDARLSWDLQPGLRLYGGGGLLVRRNPEDLGRGWLQAGVELRPPALRGRLRPVLAADLLARDRDDWEPDLSVRAGLEVDDLRYLRALQLLLEYFDGHAPDGQFFRESIEYVGLGLHVRF